MIKGNIENSLKRFLKRKVKFTLGLMVTFLITGAFAFAEGTTEKPENHFTKHNKDFIAAEEYLKGLGSEISEIDIKNNEQQGLVIKKDGEDYKVTLNNFKINGKDFNFTDKVLKKEYISEKTAKVINQSLDLLRKNNAINNIITSPTAENNGILIQNGNVYVQQGNKVINNGLIIIDNYGQKGTNKTINNGIILGYSCGQYAGGIIENYGLITVTSSTAQQILVNGTAYNYGILNAKNNVQTAGTNGNIYNYGVINGDNGQYLIGQNIKAYNYGIINSEIEKGIGQLIEHSGTNDLNENSTIKNYGIINAKYGQVVTYYYGKPTTNSTVINNGVIKSTEAGMNITKGATGTNNGIIINDEDKVFISKNLTQSNGGEVEKGKTINNGMIILSQKDNTDNITLEELGLDENNGIVLNKNYELLGNTQGGITEGVIQINTTDDISDSISSKDKKVYLKNGNTEITENLSGQNINTVITKDSTVDKSVFSFNGTVENNKLLITDTTITGYFQKDGTLLDVGNNDLSLLGKTQIIAGKDEMGLDVTAININGVLKKLGDVEISGKITGTGRLQDVATNGEAGEYISAVELDEILLQNAAQEEEGYLENGAEDNYTEISYSDLTTNKLVFDFNRTAVKKENTIKFTDKLSIKGVDGVAIDGRETKTSENNINLEFSSLDSEKVQGDIFLGTSDDDITVDKNGNYTHTINMGDGQDTFTVNNFAQNVTREEAKKDNHKELGTFNYKLEGVETIVLKGEKGDNKGWHIGSSASVSGVDSAELKIVGSELHVEMNNNYGTENVTTSLDNFAEEGTALKVTTENAEVKFTVGDKFDVSQKEFTIATNYDISGANISSAVIFKTDKINENGKDVTLTVKEASELGLSQYKGIYDAVIKTLSKDEDLRNAVNYQEADDFVKMVKDAGAQAETFYTTGYAVTKDIADTYMSVADDFGRKAGAGEWIAYGKYVNSDTEFDGGKASKGYDGDITGTVGMIEYGVDNTTSYGIIYGQGDTKVNISGNGGKLEGDNTYFGGYVKHRTEKGIDLTGNIGITKSELDLKLANDITTQGGVNHRIITDGKSDAEALTFAIKGTKDYKISDSLKVQPVISGRYSFITQDEIKSSDANFRMDKQDVTIFEGSFGGNIIKEFELSHGTLSFSTGAEYILTDVNTEDSTRYYIHESTPLKFTEEEDIADNRIEGHIGAEYIHENGVGINAKYEMIWTDKGDTNRITAGISYRF